MSGRSARALLLTLAALLPAGPAAVRAEEPPPSTRPDTPLPPPVKPVPLDPEKRVRLDTEAMVFSEVLYDAPMQGKDQNLGEFLAYNEVVLHARRQDDAELRSFARKTVTFKDLVAVQKGANGELVFPGRVFQYDILFFEGRLKSLRDVKPTKPLADAGVKSLYEGWMFPTDGADPLCVLFTDLPPGLEPAVEYPVAVPVSVAGYFFKVIRYESKNTDPALRNRRAPLIVARTLVPGPPQDPGRDIVGDWWAGFLPGMLALAGLGGALAFGLTWYFRRGDLAHRRAREDQLEKNNPFREGSA